MGEIRIIGGQWRRRKLRFPNIAELRPTTDRARETLFNWLTGYLTGARCLDAFAGSGALGLEALSRGAAWVDFVDANRRATRAIDAHIALLNANAKTHPQPFERFARGAHAPYDIIFIDPPFHSDAYTTTLDALHKYGLLHANTLLYIEHDTHHTPDLPQAYQRIKEARIGNCTMRLMGLSEGDAIKEG